MRKQPVQLRSQQVVDALVQATGQVIVERGLEHLTTIHVAARAGVSIGSLYQYFENKEALIAALLDQLTLELGDVVNHTVSPLLATDVRTLVGRLLHAAFDFICQREGLYLELLRNWFRIDIGGSLQRFEENMMDITRAYVMTHAGSLRLANVPAKSFVIINSVVFTLLRYFSVPKQPLFGREQLIDELTALITAYLTPPPAAPGSRRLPQRKPRAYKPAPTGPREGRAQPKPRPSKAQQSKSPPRKTRPSKAQQSKSSPRKTGPSKAQQSKSSPRKTGPSKAQQTQAKPAKPTRGGAARARTASRAKGPTSPTRQRAR